jgi:hypothetical protein
MGSLMTTAVWNTCGTDASQATPPCCSNQPPVRVESVASEDLMAIVEPGLDATGPER